MSSSKKIAEFPNVEAKLQKPTKQSAFERQKAEAEAKRLREAAETAAVYEDFVKSFDADDGDDGNNQSAGGGTFDGSRGRAPGFAPRGGFGGGGKRHFGGPGGLGLKSSGPGTLGPPPPSFGKKRTYDGFATGGNRRRDHSAHSAGGRLGFDDHEDAPKPLARAFDASDDEEERTAGGFGGPRSAEDKAVAKPTLRLANLPPATSPAVIRALIPDSLTVEGVRVLPPAAVVGGGDRKSMAAIVTLGAETAASDIDAAVSALQNRYLGFGHYLSLHRHLSSAAMAMAAESSVVGGGPAAGSQPFGAKPVATPGPPGNGPVHGGPGRFAPPTSYGPAGVPLNRALLHVPVQPPRDVKQLRMIHKVIEGVLEHGPEFEALLMSRPDVQRGERWAWIWDARSQGGVWYRWRLWEILTGGGQMKGRKGKYLPLFEGSHAWKVPEKQLAYEYTTGVDEFVSESEYDSEFDDEDDEEPRITTDGSKGEEEVFLNPIEKAKLVHLLSRLPTTLSKIRKGDIARITSFAITHSNRGANEIVDLIVSNLENPLAFTSANPDYKKDTAEQSGESRDVSPGPTNLETQDTSGAKLVALYAISDILSSSSTSGIRHAWRYRQLLEASLKARRVFEGLGLMPEKLNWGRLRAEKWKRSVGLVLSLWDGWCVFPNDSQELFVRSFENPPSLAKRLEEKAAAEEVERARGRWKTVEAAAATAAGDASEAGDREGESDGSYDEYTDDDELDNELLAQYHIDGESILDIDIVGLVIGGDGEGEGEGEGQGDVMMEEAPRDPGRQEQRADGEEAVTRAGVSKSTSSTSAQDKGAAAKRKRMTAADMFADSDSGEDK